MRAGLCLFLFDRRRCGAATADIVTPFSFRSTFPGSVRGFASQRKLPLRAMYRNQSRALFQERKNNWHFAAPITR